MSGILDTIDNAIADYELSADAMRWTPEPPTPSARPLIVTPTLDDLAAARLAESFDRVHLCMTAVANHFAEAMKGVSLALRPLFDELRWGKPRRPERVSRIRRAYGAKQRRRR